MKKARKLLSILLALTMFLGVFLITPVTAETQVPGKPVETIVGDVRIQVLSDTVVRIEVKGPKGFENRNTYHVVNRTDWDGAAVTVTEVDGQTCISTENYKVYVPNGATSLDNIYVTDAAGGRIWGYTSLPSASVYLPAPGTKARVWAIADNPRIIPAEWGYNPAPEDAEYADRNGWDFTNDSPDMYIFVPNGDAQQLREDFTKLTGPSEMLPLSAFGSWDSRWYAYNEETALQQIDDYRDRGFPLDNLVIDTDWRINASIGYDINTNLFPNMERFLQRAHDKNVSIMFNDHPEPQGSGDGLSKTEVEYRNKNLRNILDMGLDYWWYDRNWSVALRSPSSGIPKESWGMYLYSWITEDNDSVSRPIIMGNIDGIDNGSFNRAPNIASHRFQLQWTGDIGPSSASLKAEIRNAVRGGAIASLPYVSADIGGHTADPTKGMYARWTQFGTFSPIYRPHCTNNLKRMPWAFGEQAEAIAHEYVDMRYRLLPLYYSLAHENYETGMPMLRRLDFNYPSYYEASADDQYTLGDNILIAPIWESSDADATVVPSSWLRTEDGQTGLKGEYFNNVNLTGEPTATRIDNQLDFSWGQNAPHPSINKDNVSVRWTGKITIGDKNSFIQTVSDDGVRVWIDDELVIDHWVASDSVAVTTEKLYAANSTHDIKIEYYEGTSNAVLKLRYLAQGEDTNSRDVFIPDGRWIDVWTGDEYVGPQTITVAHPLETSPMFVRSGTIIPLAENMMYTGEKDWSQITLDVYPSTKLAGSATLYEDDTKTVAYKDGEFRTTALSTYYDESDKTFAVQVDPVQGSFSGDLAFSERTWKVRVHAPLSWGALTGATLDGEATAPVKIEKTADSTPFANQGGALDGDIYEITFSGDISKAHLVKVSFASPQDEELPVYTTVPVDREYRELYPSKSVDLTADGIYDWAHFGSIQPSTVVRKANVENRLIGVLNAGTVPYEFHDNYVGFNWTDGDAVLPESTNNILGPVSDSDFSLDVKAGPEERSLTLYVGGWRSTGEIELRDNQGDQIDVISFGDVNSNYYRKIVINFSAEEETDFHIRYTKTSPSGNITFSAAVVGDPFDFDRMDGIERTVSVDTIPEKIDMTAEGTLDWIHMGLVDGKSVNRKANVESILPIPTPASGNFSRTDDYGKGHTTISWSDGAPTQSAVDTNTSIFHGTGINFDVPASTQMRELTMYVGAYACTNQITISDDSGNIPEVYTIESPSTAPGSANVRAVTIRFRAKTDDQVLHISFKSINSQSGNVSFAGATLKNVETPPEIVSVNANLPFTFQVTTPADAKGIRLYNETGRAIGILDLSRTETADGLAWDITARIATPGEGRKISISYVDASGNIISTGEVYTVNILAVEPEVKSASFAAPTVEKNELIAISVITTHSVPKIRFFNETDRKMGVNYISKTVDEAGDYVWVYEMAIGTKGVGRTITAVGYDAAGVALEKTASASIDVI